jgi:hypothetical protein
VSVRQGLAKRHRQVQGILFGIRYQLPEAREILLPDQSRQRLACHVDGQGVASEIASQA